MGKYDECKMCTHWNAYKQNALCINTILYIMLSILTQDKLKFITSTSVNKHV